MNINNLILKNEINYYLIKFNNNIILNFKNKNKDFYNYMNLNNYYFKKEKILIPDDIFLDERNKIIFIIELKFQRVSGSVDEKIQTAPFKVFFYNKIFPSFKIIFNYILSDYFKNKKFNLDFEYLNLNKINYYYLNNFNNYEEIIINIFNQNYK